MVYTLLHLFCTGASPAFRNRDLAVVGGGDSATEEAVYLTKYGRHVSQGRLEGSPLFLALAVFCACCYAFRLVSFLLDFSCCGLLSQNSAVVRQKTDNPNFAIAQEVPKSEIPCLRLSCFDFK